MFNFQVELVLEMEETVPKSIAQRAHVKKHVEYPNKDESKVYPLRNNLFLQFLQQHSRIFVNTSKRPCHDFRRHLKG